MTTKTTKPAAKAVAPTKQPVSAKSVVDQVNAGGSYRVGDDGKIGKPVGQTKPGLTKSEKRAQAAKNKGA